MIKINNKVSKVILNFLLNFLKLVANNIDDILIFSGFTVFIVSLFLFVGTFVGLIGLSLILIIVGLSLAKVKK